MCARSAPLSAVRRILARAVSGYYERTATRLGKPRPRAAAVPFVSRFDSALLLNVHLHVIWLDGVYSHEPVVVGWRNICIHDLHVAGIWDWTTYPPSTLRLPPGMHRRGPRSGGGHATVPRDSCESPPRRTVRTSSVRRMKSCLGAPRRHHEDPLSDTIRRSYVCNSVCRRLTSVSVRCVDFIHRGWLVGLGAQALGLGVVRYRHFSAAKASGMPRAWLRTEFRCRWLRGAPRHG